MDRANLLWLIGLVAAVAVLGWFAVWYKQAPAPAAPAQPTLPGAPTPTPALTYYCADHKTMQVAFTTDPATGGGRAALTLSDGRTFALPQAMSGSGMRYEATSTRYGTDVAFIGKGDDAFLTEDGTVTYGNCTAATVTASDAPGYALYTDEGKTFSFAFPLNVQVAGNAIGFSPDWSALATSSGLALARLTVPKSYAPGTNFNDASFTVGASADPEALAACATAQGATATPAKIGDMQVTELTAHDAAAGNRYDTTSYRVVHNGECYAIEYTIHYGAIENYPKGSVKAFDEAAVAAALDEVAKSFIFLK